MTTNPMAEAIAALTAAARQERTIGAGTSNEHTESVDFAEIACHVLASVAANVGGVETLLAGRPGSWEADLVRQVVTSTVGHDESELWRWRTEPVRVAVDDAELLATEMGLDALLADEIEPLERRSAELREALEREFLTSEEREAAEELRREWQDDGLKGADDPITRLQEIWETLGEMHDAALARAHKAAHPMLAELVQVDERVKAMEELFASDAAAYAESYRLAISEILKDRGVHVEFVDDRSQADQPWQLEELVDQATSEARRTAPLPMTGRPPVNRDNVRAEVLAADVGYAARLSATGVERLLGRRGDDEG